MEKFWMIIDVSTMFEARFSPDFTVPSHAKPKYCHGIKEKAEAELFRLQAKYPAGTFVLMESVGFTEFGPESVIHIEPITPG